MAQQQPLQFAPFSSAVDVGFFHALSDRKLNIYKLDESSKSIVAHFAMGTHPEVPPLLQLTANAFHEYPPSCLLFPSLLLQPLFFRLFFPFSLFFFVWYTEILRRLSEQCVCRAPW